MYVTARCSGNLSEKILTLHSAYFIHFAQDCSGGATVITGMRDSLKRKREKMRLIKPESSDSLPGLITIKSAFTSLAYWRVMVAMFSPARVLHSTGTSVLSRIS